MLLNLDGRSECVETPVRLPLSNFCNVYIHNSSHIHSSPPSEIYVSTTSPTVYDDVYVQVDVHASTLFSVYECLIVTVSRIAR